VVVVEKPFGVGSRKGWRFTLPGYQPSEIRDGVATALPLAALTPHYLAQSTDKASIIGSVATGCKPVAHPSSRGFGVLSACYEKQKVRARRDRCDQRRVSSLIKKDGTPVADFPRNIEQARQWEFCFFLFPFLPMWRPAA
jgi:hypothetical protein